MKKVLMFLPMLFGASYAYSYSIVYSTSGEILQACECKQDLSKFPAGSSIVILNGQIVSGDKRNYRFYGSSVAYKSQAELNTIAAEDEIIKDMARLDSLSKQMQEKEYAISCTTKTAIRAIYQAELAILITEYNAIEAKY